MTRSVKLLLALVAAMSLLVAGCGSGSKDATSGTTTATAPAAGSDTTAAASTLTGTITVSAAASLTEAFTQLGDDFHAVHPDTTVDLNFDSSSTLSAQIIDGAPADVFASADIINMTKLTDADRIAGEPQAFARNALVIVTKPGNPAGITGLADLVDVGVVSLCGAEVPCGKFAQQALDTAGITIGASNITRGQNVKATLTAVTQGDAVAAIVYVTDALAAGSAVTTVTIPPAQNVVATYPIGVVAGSGNATVARAFMDHVLSTDGRAVLQRFGFLPPS